MIIKINLGLCILGGVVALLTGNISAACYAGVAVVYIMRAMDD